MIITDPDPEIKKDQDPGVKKHWILDPQHWEKTSVNR
jgi:hypothetical protein